MSERVPDGWAKQRLGDFLTYLPKSALPSGVSEKAGYYNFYVCSQNVLKSFHKEMSSPSLLFSTGGEAAVHFATGVYSYSTDVWATEVKGELCNEYAFRLLQKSIEKINYMGFQGSGIKHLDKDFIRNLEFFTPPFPEQKKIASILTSVDEVIEKTQSQIDKLQNLKKATMNELLTRGIGHTEFKDSEFFGGGGGIPKSWEVKTLQTLVSVDTECLKENTDPNYRFKYIDISCVSTGTVTPPTERLIFKEAPSRAKRIVKRGDVLIATVRPNLKAFAHFDEEGDDWVASTGFAVLRHKENSDSRFIYNIMLSDSVSRQIDKLVAGSNYPAINSTDMKKLTVLLPPLPEQQKIASILTSIDKVIEQTLSQLEQTQSLKKSLMQDLLTGKVRVSVN